MQADHSPAASVDSPDNNGYKRLLQDLLGRAIKEMDELGRAYDSQAPSTAHTSEVGWLWTQLQSIWSDFVLHKTQLDGVESLLSGSLSGVDESSEEIEAHDESAFRIVEAQKRLDEIYDLLKLKLAVENGLSNAAQQLVLIFDQVLLWWTILYYAEEGCDLLVLKEARTMTKSRFPTEDWEDITLDTTSLTNRTLPSFSSLDGFTRFCCASRWEPADVLLGNFLDNEYSLKGTGSSGRPA
ncbi:hypothetical protein QFC20_004982 [Naganishia adeliensis]|uniref:Uncharacterized protein n=1 Tax=Naganishia adeliensis TaxID=92952 RepID=A0ACC2VT85_9TREE|nr:hypothetical protein QFC20_004982 [Naganishia adeliensis]